MPYELPQERLAAQRLALQAHRIFGSRAGADALRGGLPNSGFAFQYAARAQALPQLLVSVELPPTVSQENKAALAAALSTALVVCQKQMTQGFAVDPSYEVRASFAPREFNAVVDDVTGALAYAAITNVKGQKASKLRLRIAGTVPGVGESHFVFLSDCSGWRRRDGAFDVHNSADCGGRERTCSDVAAEWAQAMRGWS